MTTLISLSVGLLAQFPVNGLTETYSESVRASWLLFSGEDLARKLEEAMALGNFEEISRAVGVYSLASELCEGAAPTKMIDRLPTFRHAPVTCEDVSQIIGEIVFRVFSAQEPPPYLSESDQNRWRFLVTLAPEPRAAPVNAALPPEPCPWREARQTEVFIETSFNSVSLKASLDRELQRLGDEWWQRLEAGGVAQALALLGFPSGGYAAERMPAPHCVAELVDQLIAGAIRASERDQLKSAYALSSLSIEIQQLMNGLFGSHAHDVFNVSSRGERAFRVHTEIESWFYAAGLDPRSEDKRGVLDGMNWISYPLPGGRGLVPLPDVWEAAMFYLNVFGGFNDPMELSGRIPRFDELLITGFSFYSLLEADYPGHLDLFFSMERRFGLYRYDIQAPSLVLWSPENSFRIRYHLLNLTILDTPCPGGQIDCGLKQERRLFVSLPFVSLDASFLLAPYERFNATLTYAFDLRVTDKTRFLGSENEVSLLHVYADHRVHLSLGWQPWFYADMFFERQHLDLHWHVSSFGGNLGGAFPVARGRFGEWIEGVWFLTAKLEGSLHFFHGDSEQFNDNPVFPQRHNQDAGEIGRWMPEARLTIGIQFAGEE